MSKTDKTTPYRLKLASPWWMQQYRQGVALCPCWGCRGYVQYDLDHRVARMRQRLLLAELIKTSRQDIEEVDTSIPPSNRWWFRR